MAQSSRIGRRLRAAIGAYWQSEVGRYYADSSQRYIGYLLLTVLVGAVLFLLIGMRNQWMGSAPFYYVPRTISAVFAIESAVNFGLWGYLSQDQNEAMMQALSAAETQWDSQAATPVEAARTALDRPVFLPMGNGRIRRLDPAAIQCFSAEGHYCRFFTVGDPNRRQLFAKIALKDILAKLPPGRFLQIHRSHVINLAFVDHLKRRSRSVQIFLTGLEHPLPVSRHRMAELHLSLAPFMAS